MIFMALMSNAFKEFIFPNIDNTDYKLFIDKDVFGLRKSINLSFEVINHRWSILADTKSYEVIHHRVSVDRVDFDEKNLVTIKTINNEIIKAIVFNNELDFAPFYKFDITKNREITVGKDSANTIRYDFENLVSKNQCAIVYSNRRHYLHDLSSNGVYVNNTRVNKTRELVFGDIIEIFGLKMIYLNNILAVTSSTGTFEVSDQLDEYIDTVVSDASVKVRHQDFYFNRSPRIFPAICEEQVVVEAPTTPQLTRKKSLLLTIGPSLTMAIPMMLGCTLMILSMTMSGNNTSTFMYTGLITAFGSAVLGALWAFLNLRDANRREQEDEAQRFNLYSNYLLQMSDYIKEKYRQNTDALYMLYPSASQCCSYSENSMELWNRNITHSDFLYHRLGLGDMDFQVDIKVPDERFSMVYDSLKDKPNMLYQNFKTLVNVPVGIDFSQSNLYGVVAGKDKSGAYCVVDNLIAQITATTSYTDAKIVFCSAGDNQDENKHYEYVKWLPHVWSESKDIRYYATNKQETTDVLFELSNIIRQRVEVAQGSHEKKMFRPHYFFFVTDIKLLEDELICKYIFDNNMDYGVTTFLLTDDYCSLPNNCENIIQNDSNFSGYYNVKRSLSESMPIKFDKVTTEELQSFAKRISSVRVKEVEDDNSIVQSLTFFEMYNANTLEDFHILDQWRKNKTDSSMKALIGKKVGSADCYLDIHEKHHGPHGLIAGTTGSGKSELIQTFMLSLAINYSPDDIAFFVIDFKGGGMANLFVDLPHMAGQISNLSGNQISRAMISIKSENLRRQRIFSEYGVNNINLYTQLYKSGKASVPIPHLLIIIDEFAELKKEEPEFMHELISVAQVGRSLGVHLILATQKPSGTVDDNIWSNAKFRLCLRVQDRQDSNDMLHKPDAAYITQAGRCYLQVGNDEIYELFQSGFSGAVYDEQMSVVKSEIATMITPTGKTALVGSHTKMQLKEQEKNKWYTFLYSTAKQFLEEHTYNINHSDPFAIDKDYIPEKVISAAINAGYNISISNAELRDVINFIELMPNGNMSEHQAVEYIKMKAAQNNIKLPELKEKTQLEALVDYISKIAKRENYTQKSRLWMPLLKNEIELKEITDITKLYNKGVWPVMEKWSLSAIVGLYDDPHNQSQLPFVVDFEEGGHLALCGSVSSGKSTFLQTLIFSMATKYSPDLVNFYLLDFSSGMLSIFENLPHTGGVIRDNEQEKTAKFFTFISSIIEDRKRKMAGGSFSQYVKTHKDEIMPAIFVVIDNFASFKEKTENAYENVLVQLSREGIGYGVFLICTSAGFGMSEIQNRIGDNIKTVVSLEMSDKFKYMDVLRTTHIDVMPEPAIKGRGIGFVENRLLEFQTALAVRADNDYERNLLIEKVCESMDKAWLGKRAKPIPSIPENASYDDICQLDDYNTAIATDSLIPYAYKNEDATVYSVDLSRTFCYSITGKQRTGKTNVLRLLMLACAKKQASKVVIEKSLNELKTLATDNDFRYISTDVQILQYFKEITPDFIERNKYKKELQEQGLTDEEIYIKMQKFEPIYIFIADLIEFVDSVYHPQDDIGNMSGFFENIFDKGYLHNIFFFSCVNVDDAASVAGVKAYQSFISHKKGVHLGGNTAAQRVFNFQNIHYTQMTKQSKKGEGLAPAVYDDTVAEKIIIPFAGGRII